MTTGIYRLHIVWDELYHPDGCTLCRAEIEVTECSVTPHIYEGDTPYVFDIMRGITEPMPACLRCARRVNPPLFDAWDRYRAAEYAVWDIADGDVASDLVTESYDLLADERWSAITIDHLDRASRFLTDARAGVLAEEEADPHRDISWRYRRFHGWRAAADKVATS